MGHLVRDDIVRETCENNSAGQRSPFDFIRRREVTKIEFSGRAVVICVLLIERRAAACAAGQRDLSFGPRGSKPHVTCRPSARRKVGMDRWSKRHKPSADGKAARKWRDRGHRSKAGEAGRDPRGPNGFFACCRSHLLRTRFRPDRAPSGSYGTFTVASAPSSRDTEGSRLKIRSRPVQRIARLTLVRHRLDRPRDAFVDREVTV